MVNLIVQLIVALLIAGFVYFIWTKLRDVVAQWVAAPFMQLIDILVWVLIGAMILFWVIIPLLHSLAGAGGSFLR